MSEIIAARSAGFCFGVARAVKIAQELADSAQTPRMLGSVIHNQRVTEDLARQGMPAISGSILTICRWVSIAPAKSPSLYCR